MKINKYKKIKWDLMGGVSQEWDLSFHLPVLVIDLRD
jgi:hypothetical protein